MAIKKPKKLTRAKERERRTMDSMKVNRIFSKIISILEEARTMSRVYGHSTVEIERNTIYTSLEIRGEGYSEGKVVPNSRPTKANE